MREDISWGFVQADQEEEEEALEPGRWGNQYENPRERPTGKGQPQKPSQVFAQGWLRSKDKRSNKSTQNSCGDHGDWLFKLEHKDGTSGHGCLDASQVSKWKQSGHKIAWKVFKKFWRGEKTLSFSKASKGHRFKLWSTGKWRKARTVNSRSSEKKQLVLKKQRIFCKAILRPNWGSNEAQNDPFDEAFCLLDGGDKYKPVKICS